MWGLLSYSDLLQAVVLMLWPSYHIPGVAIRSLFGYCLPAGGGEERRLTAMYCHLGCRGFLLESV
jgi:hypothetical protein